jgi:hypothetical protein
MKSKLLAALFVAAGILSAGTASAALVTLDFDGPTSFSSIGSYYASQGVTFGLDALALQNDGLGGGINGEYFTNNPSPLGAMAPVGPDATMNVAPGFNGLASIWYSATDATTVSIWSGVDGTGTLLHTWNLANNAQVGCGDSPFCNWTQLSFDLGANIGRSIVFGNAASVAGFDNVAVNTVPVPAALPLLAMGVAGMGAFMRRRKQGAAA